jgi:anthranilate phosphoribosyltransferase
VDDPQGFDARALFTALARHDVEYVTVGGIAIQAHGGQRLTQDLNVAIAASSENHARLAQALLDLDARILGPHGERSKAVPSAALLASSEQWHLITPHGSRSTTRRDALAPEIISASRRPLPRIPRHDRTPRRDRRAPGPAIA